MAKKKATKKRTKKRDTVAKKTAETKKRNTKVTRKRSKPKRLTRTTSRSNRTRKITKLHRGTLKPTKRLEKVTISIEQGETGDLIVTESGGGAIQVHHTVHRGESVTPIPGKSYADLKALGPGSHEIDVRRSF